VSLMLRGRRVSFCALVACLLRCARKNFITNIPCSNGLAQRLDGVHRRRSIGLWRRDLCSLRSVGHTDRRENRQAKGQTIPINQFNSSSQHAVSWSKALAPSSKCPTQSRRIDFGRLAPRALAEVTQCEVKAMQQRKE
jgi:hypothetical protein